MGKEIVYCEICGERILEQEFQKGRAITILNKNYCVKCKEEAVKNITMDDVFEEHVETPPKKSSRSSSMMKAVRADIPTRTPPKGIPQSDVRAPAPANKAAPKGGYRNTVPPGGSSKAPLIIGGVVGAVAIVILLVMAFGSKKDEGGGKEEGGKPKGDPAQIAKALQKAEKAYNDSVAYANRQGIDPESAMNFIKGQEAAVKDTEFESKLADLYKEMDGKREEFKANQAIDDILTEVKSIIQVDAGFYRFADVDNKIKEAKRKTEPKCRARLADIGKVWDGYKEKYEAASKEAYDSIYDKAYNLATKERRYKDAIAVVDTYPQQFRFSSYWKDLERLKRDWESQKGELPLDRQRGDGDRTANASFKTPTVNEWVSLFNGSDLTGWKRMPQNGDAAENWKFTDGALRGTSSHADGGEDYIFDLLATDFEGFGDFDLEFQARVSKGDSLVLVFRLTNNDGNLCVTPLKVPLEPSWNSVHITMKEEKARLTKGSGSERVYPFQGMPSTGKLALGLYAGCNAEVKDLKVRLLK